MFAANNCKGDEGKFRQIFLGSVDHYQKKHDIPANEAAGLRAWLESLIAKDLQYYVNGTHTSFCESFHALCNKLCPKALIKSFMMYCMRKECAVIQWNLKKLKDINQPLFINVPYRIWISEECVARMHGAEETTWGLDSEDEEVEMKDVSSGEESSADLSRDDDE